MPTNAAPTRTRYAPSPTGDPHVGNVRSALFAWLFARNTGGVFAVRIEDTDQERRIPGSEERILESLRWLGIEWDEGPDIGGQYGPYVQSQRLDGYGEGAERLVELDAAYYCYCPPERLDAIRAAQQKRNVPTGYDRRCRNLSPEERAQEEAENGAHRVVRFKTPLSGRTTFNDVIRGDVSWENRLIDDFVILKSDGFPTYHLANVVDDVAMAITHVIRGDEWMSSAPRHAMIYEAFGYTPPAFAHLPLILGADRTKLSKRHGSVALLDYRDEGFLPEAMLNFLALLGWSLDDKTTQMTREELLKGFSLDRVSASPAMFDRDKLEWLNGVYIREMSPEAFVEASRPYLERGLSSDIARPLDDELVRQAITLTQDRARVLSEMPELCDFFFADEVSFPPALIWAGMGDKTMKRMADADEDLWNVPLPEDAGTVQEWLKAAGDAIETIAPWNHDAIEARFRALVEELGTSGRKLFGAVRVATTGRTAAPPLFVTLEAIGQERSESRLRSAAAAFLDTELAPS